MMFSNISLLPNNLVSKSHVLSKVIISLKITEFLKNDKCFQHRHINLLKHIPQVNKAHSTYISMKST